MGKELADDDRADDAIEHAQRRVLHLDVIAEGVERLEELDVLRDLGCDYVQGHYLSPPLPAAAMRQWLSARG